MKLEFARNIFQKSSRIKFHENPKAELLNVHGRKDRWTLRSLIVAFRNFTNMSKKDTQLFYTAVMNLIQVFVHTKQFKASLRNSARRHLLAINTLV